VGIRIKNWFSLSNILFLLTLGFLVINQVPTITNNFKKEGLNLESLNTGVINSSPANQKVQFPPPNGKAMAIFWSTTCGPCKLEMARLKTSVEEGKIPKLALFAINPYETNSQIKRFLAEKNFPFTFIQDTGISQALNVQGTPTTVFIDNGKVISMKTGISLTGIWDAEEFLKE